jgi:hypothetical protein
MLSICTHRPNRPLVALALSAPLALLAAPARAQSSLDQPPAASSVAAHEASAERSAASRGPAPETPPRASVRIAAGRGLTVESADQRVSLTVRGYVQGRVTEDVPTPALVGGDVVPTTLFSVRRARVILAGALLGPTLTYQLHFGLAPQDFAGASPLFDAFVTWAPLRDLSVRVGQFFVPFNRNRWIPITRQMMLERPIATNEFNLDRDLGVMLFSNDLGGVGGRLSYALGVFSGAGRNRLEADYGLLYVARFGVNPLGCFDDHDHEWDLVRSGPRLALGVAGALNHRASTYAQIAALAMPDTNKYDRAHLTGDLLFKAYGFSLQFEGLARWSLTPTGLASATRPGWGYTVQASYLTALKVGFGARWSQIFAMPAAMDTTAFRDGYEAGGVIAYHALDGALTVGVDYTLRDENVAYPRHEARVQVQAMF